MNIQLSDIYKIQEVLEGTKSPNFLTLFENKVSVASFNYGDLCTLVSMVTLPTIGPSNYGPLLHKYFFSFHTRMIWLPRLPNLTLDSPRLTGASFASTYEVSGSAS
jgi:hypothetical protein